MSMLADRRQQGPYGLQGGDAGSTGKNEIVRKGKSIKIAAKGSADLQAGDRIRIESPGGGGWGKMSDTL
jgi:N-methylhydantoinase B